jgi:hypothetical protein
VCVGGITLFDGRRPIHPGDDDRPAIVCRRYVDIPAIETDSSYFPQLATLESKMRRR